MATQYDTDSPLLMCCHQTVPSGWPHKDSHSQTPTSVLTNALSSRTRVLCLIDPAVTNLTGYDRPTLTGIFRQERCIRIKIPCSNTNSIIWRTQDAKRNTTWAYVDSLGCCSMLCLPTCTPGKKLGLKPSCIISPTTLLGDDFWMDGMEVGMTMLSLSSKLLLQTQLPTLLPSPIYSMNTCISRWPGYNRMTGLAAKMCRRA